MFYNTILKASGWCPESILELSPQMAVAELNIGELCSNCLCHSPGGARKQAVSGKVSRVHGLIVKRANMVMLALKCSLD